VDGTPASFAGWQIRACATHQRPAALTRYQAVLDASKLPGPLTIRARQPGDRFQPTGMTGSKELARFFIDAKIPRTARSTWPLVTSAEAIVWVVGLRLDRRFAAGPDSDNLIVLEAIPPGQEPNPP
jgi:tRNA(Ile)-lysidine synthase